MDLNQTDAYIQGSRGSPLEISFTLSRRLFRHDVFDLTLPFIDRFKALTLSGFLHNILELTEHLDSPAPLLEKLDIQVRGTSIVVIGNTLLDGNLSSLRELYVWGHHRSSLAKYGERHNV